MQPDLQVPDHAGKRANLTRMNKLQGSGIGTVIGTVDCAKEKTPEKQGWK
jgi:hypothetical protein